MIFLGKQDLIFGSSPEQVAPKHVKDEISRDLAIIDQIQGH